jgi:WD40 repeat protein
MDGSVILIGYGTGLDGLSASVLKPSIELKCIKYVKGLAWSPSAPILAIASADGIVVVAQVSNLQDSGHVKVEVLDKLHLSGTIESICFSGDGTNLICYTRETPYLSYFNLEKGFEQTKINLNKGGGGGAAAGGFEEHVSFAVMDIAVSPNGKFLALATDTSRNIVIDAVTGKHIRNLYGHTNDGFSNPKIAWSCNGQYVLGNTQEDGSVCVWDVASASIVKRLVGHTNPIRGLFSSRLSDTLVTTSFDKQTKIWLTPME